MPWYAKTTIEIQGPQAKEANKQNMLLQYAFLKASSISAIPMLVNPGVEDCFDSLAENAGVESET